MSSHSQVSEEYRSPQMHLPAAVDHLWADHRPHFQTETRPINCGPITLTVCDFITTTGKVRLWCDVQAAFPETESLASTSRVRIRLLERCTSHSAHPSDSVESGRVSCRHWHLRTISCFNTTVIDLLLRLGLSTTFGTLRRQQIRELEHEPRHIYQQAAPSGIQTLPRCFHPSSGDNHESSGHVTRRK